MQTKHLCVFIHIIRSKAEIGTVKLVLSPPVIFLVTVPRQYFLKDSSFLSVFGFVILLCLFLAALWSPVGKGLAYWLSCM